MELTDAIQQTLTTWKTLAAKRGRLNVVEAEIESLQKQKQRRDGFIEAQESNNQTDAVLGSRVALAIIESEIESKQVEQQILAVEIDSLKSALSSADTTGLSKSVKDAISEYAE